MPRSSWAKNHAPFCAATIIARQQLAHAQLPALERGQAQQQIQQGGEQGAEQASGMESGEVDGAGEGAGMQGGVPCSDEQMHRFDDGLDADFDGGAGYEELLGSNPSEQGQEAGAEQPQQRGAGSEQGGAQGAQDGAMEDAAADAAERGGALEIETETEPSEADPEDLAAQEDAPQEAGDGEGSGQSSGESGDEDAPANASDSEEDDGSYNEADRYKKGSAAWRYDQRAQPLWRDHKSGNRRLSALQAIFVLMDWRRRHKLKTAAFNELLRLLADLFLPPDNLLTPSIYQGRQLISARDLAEVEWHLCPTGCTAFPPVKRAAWRQHAGDACERCHGKRFSSAGSEDAGAGGAKLKPARVLYNFGVARMVRSLFRDPDFSAARREGMQGDPTSLRHYPEYARLNAKLGGALDDPNNVLLEVAADGFQSFSGSQLSSQLVVLRCADLPPHERGKDRYVRVAALVGGRNTPPCIDGMLRPLLDELCRHMPGPGGEDLVVTERCRGADGSITVQRLRVRLILTAFVADMIMRQKVALFPGVKAELPCGFCRFQGTLCGTQYLPKGYQTPVIHNLTFQPPRMLHANAEELWVSDKEHDIRGRLVDAGTPASLLGCHGTCCIAKRLPYVSLSTLFPLPVGHLLLLGLLKSFWVLALTTVSKGQARPIYVLPNRAKHELTARCAQLRVTSDFGRSLRDIVKYHRLYTMEEWAQLADCFGAYLAREDLLGPVLGPIWTLLSAVTTFVLRAMPGRPEHPYTDAALNDFERQAWELAVRIERDLPPSMCTLNLHQAQHLARQARLLGPPSLRTELWMERAIKVAKRPTKHSVSRALEAMVARMLLDNLAVEALSCKPGMKTFHQWVPAYSAAELQGPDFDKRDAESGCILLAKGHALKQREHAAAVQLVRQHIAQHALPGWQSAQVSGGQLRKFTAAQLGGGNVIHSAAHQGSARISSYVPIGRRIRTGRLATHVARVLHFLRVQQGDATLRLAVCQIYTDQPQREGMYVARLADVWSEQFPLDVSILGPPLVTAIPPDSGQLFGLAYHGVSKLA